MVTDDALSTQEHESDIVLGTDVVFFCGDEVPLESDSGVWFYADTELVYVAEIELPDGASCVGGFFEVGESFVVILSYADAVEVEESESVESEGGAVFSGSVEPIEAFFCISFCASSVEVAKSKVVLCTCISSFCFKGCEEKSFCVSLILGR